jgi:D-threonate/D-erythronate kinase
MRFRLLADDRTGAIDAAVRFVPTTGPLLVRWDLANALHSMESFGFDLGTREMTSAVATRLATAAADTLRGSDIAYFKCDSQLRGPTAEGIAACLRSQQFTHCVIAPAFPAQRRVTRSGRQWATAQGIEDWRIVGPDLATQLSESGFPVSRCRPGDSVPNGVSLWDAETLQDLYQIVAEGRQLSGMVLWCGSAGLAEAISGTKPQKIASIDAPFLALIGTNNSVTRRQLSHVAAWRVDVDLDRAADVATAAALLQTKGGAVVTASVPELANSEQAAALPRPETLFVTGGETLSGVCSALEVEALEVHGEIEPGIPVSVLKGGKWDGVRIISKSGAFGNESLIARLICCAHS